MVKLSWHGCGGGATIRTKGQGKPKVVPISRDYLGTRTLSITLAHPPSWLGWIAGQAAESNGEGRADEADMLPLMPPWATAFCNRMMAQKYPEQTQCDVRGLGQDTHSGPGKVAVSAVAQTATHHNGEPLHILFFVMGGHLTRLPGSAHNGQSLGPLSSAPLIAGAANDDECTRRRWATIGLLANQASSPGPARVL